LVVQTEEPFTEAALGELAAVTKAVAAGRG
jgi:hypothetical protein